MPNFIFRLSSRSIEVVHLIPRFGIEKVNGRIEVQIHHRRPGVSDPFHDGLLRNMELGDTDRYKRRPSKVKFRDELTVSTVRLKLHQLYL